MATMQTQPKVVPPRASNGEGAAAPEAPVPSAAELSEIGPAATGWLERVAQRFGRPKLYLLTKQRKAIVSELRSIPQRMQKITNQARLVLELADDFRSGAYRSISWVSIAVAAACLVYAVSPGDVIPDALPGLGAIDDMIVLTVAMRFLERDMRAYCRFKGYEETEYF